MAETQPLQLAYELNHRHDFREFKRLDAVSLSFLRKKLRPVFRIHVDLGNNAHTEVLPITHRGPLSTYEEYDPQILQKFLFRASPMETMTPQ